MNITEMLWATGRSKRKVDSVIKMAIDMQKDRRKKERIKKYECKGCFYYPRIGGSAMTEGNCALCDSHQLHSSTNTDVLCLDCAKKNKLCRHCGGDIDLRTKRRKWPTN